MKNYIKSVIGYGFYISLIVIFTTVIVYVFDLVLISLWSGLIIGVFSFVLNVILLIYFGKKIRNTYFGSAVKYGKALVNALLMSVVVIVVIVIYNFVFLKWIDPGYQEKIQIGMVELVEDKMYKSGHMTDYQIDRMISEMRKKESPTLFRAIIGNLWSSGLMWLISSLIAAVFVKKKSENPFEEAVEEDGKNNA